MTKKIVSEYPNVKTGKWTIPYSVGSNSEPVNHQNPNKMAAILSTIQNMNALNYLNTDDVQYSSSHCIYSYKVHKIERLNILH